MKAVSVFYPLISPSVLFCDSPYLKYACITVYALLQRHSRCTCVLFSLCTFCVVFESTNRLLLSHVVQSFINGVKSYMQGD